MIDITEKVYTAFGEVLNDPKYIEIYSPNEREVIFYRCNQNNNRNFANEETLRGGHGILCINSIKTATAFLRRSLDKNADFCALYKEKICNVSDISISINYFSNEDICLNLLSNLKSFLNLSEIKDLLTNRGIAILDFSDIRRLDSIIDEKYEYRAQMDLTIQASISEIEIERRLIEEINYDISACFGRKIEEKIVKTPIECKK